MKRAIAGLTAASSLLLATADASADQEAWAWFEYRAPAVRAERPSFPRIDLRVFTDLRFNRRSDGLHQSFLRTGPLFFLTDFLFVGLHGTVYADRLPSGVFDREGRVELEPNLFGRVGAFTFNDRNRLEARFRSQVTYRYRNQLRVNYAPKDAWLIPFVWDEVLLDLSGQGFNQNRAQAGVGFKLSANTRLDLGYMLRSRKSTAGAWDHDHIANVYLFVDVPQL